MSETWREVKLGDALRVHHGWAFPSGPCRDALGDGSPKLIRIGDFARQRGSWFDPSRPQEFVGPFPHRFVLSPGDLLVAMTCQTADGAILGWPMRVPSDGQRYLHNQRIGRVETDPEQLDSAFAYYLFASAWMNRQLFASATGSKILHTAPDRIHGMRARLPDVVTQQRIANVLGSLDALLGADRALAEYCLDLAAALYAAATASGCEVLPLSQVVELVSGGTPKTTESSYWGGSIPWFSVVDAPPAGLA
jgi:type I restriction enzyme S subunit